MANSVEEIIDFIENFDQKNIGVSFFSTPIRSGSVLFHSLLDSHPEILHFPNMLLTYCDWEYALQFSSPESLIEDFFTKSFLLFDRVSELGPNQQDYLLLRFDLIQQEMLKLAPHLGLIDRKKLILLFHCAYANVFNISLKSIKTLFIHGHLLSNVYGYYSYVLMRERTIIQDDIYPLLDFQPTDPLKQPDTYLQAVLSDFPNAQFIMTIRNPFPGLYSFIKTLDMMTDNPYMHISDLTSYLTRSYLPILNYYSMFALQQQLGERLKLVKFEDIHLQTEETMRSVADFMGIRYCDSMLETTFGGLQWSGVGITRDRRVITGTNPDLARKDKDWETGWDDYTKLFAAVLMNPLAKAYGYESYAEQQTPTADISGMIPSEFKVFQAYPGYLIEKFYGINQQIQGAATPQAPIPPQNKQVFEYYWGALHQNIQAWQDYPNLRQRLLNTILQAGASLGNLSAVC